jgi:hypothetical protein
MVPYLVSLIKKTGSLLILFRKEVLEIFTLMGMVCLVQIGDSDHLLHMLKTSASGGGGGGGY